MKTIGILIGIFLLHYCSAQNLVPNYSFELFSSCPILGPGDVVSAIPWVAPTLNTPEYFNECSPLSSTSSVPKNFAGYQWARTGKAYAGITTFAPSLPNTRDYVQVQLTDSLVAGRLYCVGYYVNLSNIVQYASNGFSAYFSNTPISCSSGCFFSYTPQFNYSGSVVSDTLNWTLIAGTFTAAGGEKYMTIGNFNNDTNTNFSIVNSGAASQSAYYYIDDVYVGTCDTIKPPPVVSSLTIPNVFTPNNDQQNDVFSISSYNIQSLNCQIFNRWGVKVWELTTPLESWDGHDKTGIPCSEGVYFYVLNATGTDSRVYHQTGFIQLSR